MGDSLTTQPTLLIRLRDAADTEAWRHFVELYGPMIYQFARAKGLQDADAADVMQNVLQGVTRGIRTLDYDAKRGSFRGWLFTIARNQIGNFLDNRKHGTQGEGGTRAQILLEQQPARSDADAAFWHETYQRRIMALAIAKVQDYFEDASWQAFRLTMIEGQSAKEAAMTLGMTVGALYTAKSRVLNRIKKEIQKLQVEMEP